MMLFKVVQKSSSATNHNEKASSRMKVFWVLLQVLGKLSNTLCEKGNLHLGRARVRTVNLKLVDDFLFPLFC